MKAWMTVMMLSVGSLAACGPSKELAQARGEVETLRQENAVLKTRAGELEGTLKKATQERDQLKAVVGRLPAPAASPSPAQPAPVKKGSATARK
ncbi:hypothetical protein SAMN05444354_105337 [Stigmatella aurantiaca]|uniref:Lipoprotein n=1 Tax=Stigmatella aurantiaca TaxID=41 RepID=A0A1H7PNH5_STIAU|nr:hypothetical protein [Stigmatella aurantiaca]SEL36795.1 hypothetical protein SAMN05444354_105337 [Stigmatella aurantiaca]